MQVKQAQAVTSQVSTQLTKVGLFSRFAGYFVDRQRKIAVIGALALAMYVAQRRGYVKSLFVYLFSKFQERMEKQMEDAQKEMSRQEEKSGEFTRTLRDYSERTSGLLSMTLSRYFQDKYDLDKIKESLRNKALSAPEKAKNWNAFKSSVMKSMLLSLVSKSFLSTAWLIKDLVLTKAKSKLEDMVEKNDTKERKFLADCVESCREFISTHIDATIKMLLEDFMHVIDELAGKLDWKLSEQVSIDNFIDRLEQVKSQFLEEKQGPRDHEPDSIEMKFKSHCLSKKNSCYRFIHKRFVKDSVTFKELGGMVFKTVFGSISKVEVHLATTLFSKNLLMKLSSYRLDSNGAAIVSHLLQETKRKSTDKLSTIIEFDEKIEDNSELAEDKSLKRQMVYENSHVWEGRDFERQQTIISQLEKVTRDSISVFMDGLTNVNTQLLAEFALEFQFKKFANRLALFKRTSVEYGGDIPFMKLLTSIHKIVEEEFLDKQAGKNDMQMYEMRSKELFSLVKKQAGEPLGDQALINLNIQIAEEAKMHAILQRSSREFAARLFFDEEFETFYGEEFDQPNHEKRSPAKSEQMEMMALLSRLKTSGQGLDLD